MFQSLVPGESLARLFDPPTETMVWSALQGEMGEILGNPAGEVLNAAVLLGDFCIPAGVPDGALLAHCFARSGGFLLLVPPDDGWCRMTEATFGADARPRTRYALQKDASGLDPKRLAEFCRALPAGYTLTPLTERWFDFCKGEFWCRDFVSRFADAADYARRGLGFLVLWEGMPVAGASSYSVYREGIEIEVQTLPAHRKKGLARAASAALILECLRQGRYPNWDAANDISLHLAQTLGYRPGREYRAYHIYR